MRRYTPRGLLFRLLMLLLACGVLMLALWLNIGCLFRNITGIPCPGCGMSRAWLAALRLDLITAFRYHPMFWSVPVLMAYCLFDGQIVGRKWLNFGLLGFIALGALINYIVVLVSFFSGNATV